MSAKFFDYFPTPRFLEMPYVGLSITPRVIRMIEMVRNKRNGFKIGRFAEKKLTSYDAAAPFTTNQELIETLVNLKKENSIKFIEVALPEEKAYVFKTEVPFRNDLETRSNIEFHLEENVPLSLEESLFDYHVVEKPKDQLATMNGREVTVSVLPKTVVNDYVELFKKVGLTPISFLVESQALAKAVIKKGDQNTYLIVNIDNLRSGFSIVSEESVVFTSSLSIGAEDFTSAVIKQFNVSTEEAQKIKRQSGFIKNKDNPDLFFALINTASALKDEIERIYIYWHTHSNPNQKENPRIKKILLAGKDASMAGFKEYLAETIRAETALVDVWTNVFSLENYIPPIEFEDSLNFGVAVGLALPKL